MCADKLRPQDLPLGCLRLNKLASRASIRLPYAVPRRIRKPRPRGILTFAIVTV